MQPGSAIVAQRLLEHPLGLSLQAWLGVGVGLHGAVDILAVIQPDRPLVHLLYRLCRLGPVLGILAGFLEHVGAIGHQRDLKRHVVQRADGVLKRHLPWFEFADGVELGVGRLDSGVHRVQRGLWRALERWQRNDRVVALRDTFKLGPVGGEFRLRREADGRGGTGNKRAQHREENRTKSHAPHATAGSRLRSSRFRG